MEPSDPPLPAEDRSEEPRPSAEGQIEDPRPFAEDQSKNPPAINRLDRVLRRFARASYFVAVLLLYAVASTALF